MGCGASAVAPQCEQLVADERLDLGAERRRRSGADAADGERKPSRRSSAEREAHDKRKAVRRHSSAKREAHGERKTARRRSSAEREAAAKGEPGTGFAARPLQMKPTESFAHNFKYQDPDAWRSKREEDELENFADYKKEKGRRQLTGELTAEEEALSKQNSKNLRGREEHMEEDKLQAYAEYRKIASGHGSWVGGKAPVDAKVAAKAAKGPAKE